MTSENNNSLAKRYFISKNPGSESQYDEYWIRYVPERISNKKYGSFPQIFATFLLIFLSFIFIVSNQAPDAIQFILGLSLILSILFFVSIIINPNLFLKCLYPTHLNLDGEGITLHWMHSYFKGHSNTIGWEKVSYITSTDRKKESKVSIDINFNIDSGSIPLQDKVLYSLLSPVMANGWITSSSPTLTANIDGIASSEDRKKLKQALREFVPSYKVEPKVADDLNMYLKFESYTDIWLETLTDSKSRSSESLLSKGQELSGGTYEIIEHIGAGGESLVYKAKLIKPIPSQISLDGINRNQTMIDMSDLKELNIVSEKELEKPLVVVLKEFVLPSHASINARQRVLKNIREEAVLWRKMRDPNIVRLLDFFAEDQRAYIVLEFVDGKSLRAVAKENEGFLPEKRIIELSLVMCDILTYLHRKSPKVIHRDFTPGNLILDKDGILKLTDFNIAQQLEHEATKSVAGKLSYIPPEQFKAEACVESDIYALGGCLFYLATKSDPTPLTELDPKSINTSLSDSFNNIVGRCTKQDRVDRYHSVIELKDEIEKLK